MFVLICSLLDETPTLYTTTTRCLTPNSKATAGGFAIIHSFSRTWIRGPLLRKGSGLDASSGDFPESPRNRNKEVQVDIYHSSISYFCLHRYYKIKEVASKTGQTIEWSATELSEPAQGYCVSNPHICLSADAQPARSTAREADSYGEQRRTS